MKRSNNNPPRQDNLELWFAYKMETDNNPSQLAWRSYCAEVRTIPAPQSPKEATSTSPVSAPLLHDTATRNAKGDKFPLKYFQLRKGSK
jgi:hypothetical protein